MNGQFLGQQWRPSFQTFCQCTSCSYCCVLHSASFSLAFCIWNIISTTLLICIRRRRGERPLRGEKPVSAFFPLSLFFAAAVPWQFSIRLLFSSRPIDPTAAQQNETATDDHQFFLRVEKCIDACHFHLKDAHRFNEMCTRALILEIFF